MMKKVTAFLILLQLFTLVLTQQADARPIWDTPESTQLSNQLVFSRPSDVYILRYGGGSIPADAVASRLNFWSSVGNYFDLYSSNKPSGTYYLTCNGTYILELLNASGDKVAETKQIITTKIVKPTCSSWSNGAQEKERNELNLSSGSPSNGTIRLDWQAQPGAIKYEIHKDGDKIHETTDTNYTVDSAGTYTVAAVDGNGDVLGESDYFTPEPYPTANGGENACGSACDWIMDALACPAWSEYMGEWKGMLNEVFSPPHYQMVADIMRDTIVPAMGQEMVNRAPEMAKIYADEFQSREKPVAPPPPLPAYNVPEPLPKLQDLPAAIPFDVTQNTPDFTPDFSESKPFVIPDPADVQLDDTDAGYAYPDETENESPAYVQQPQQLEPDKGYVRATPSAEPAPSYKVENAIANDPGPEYYSIFNGSGYTQIPIYKGKNSNNPSPPPDYQVGTSSTPPPYKIP